MAMRQKELGALGMELNEKGQVIAQSTLVSEMEGQLIEESGLKCCICLEGYKNQPQKVCMKSGAWLRVTIQNRSIESIVLVQVVN